MNPPTLEAAFLRHQSGDLAGAEAGYRQILAIAPNSIDACQLLGALLVQRNQAEEAVGFIQRAISLAPNVAQYHNNLGSAYSRLKKLDQAVESYKKSLALEPKNFDAHKNLGSVYCKQHKYREALPHLLFAFEVSPSFTTVLQLGFVSQKLGDSEKAISYYERALAENPNHLKATIGLAQALLEREEPEERTAELWQHLVSLAPQNVAYLNNLATIQKNLKRYDEAEKSCRQALELSSDYLPALCNLGIVHASRGEFSEAKSLFNQILQITSEPRVQSSSPTDSGPSRNSSNADLNPATWIEIRRTAFSQLATIANTFGDLEQVHACLDEALAITPNDAECQLMRAFAYLAAGNLHDGFEHYEWRRKTKHKPRTLAGPEWRGELAQGKTLLIHAEQGLGDAIHFIRYAKFAQSRTDKVIFLCHKPIVELMRTCSALTEVVPDGAPLPDYELQLPLMSLPFVAKTSLETVPNEIPYLAAKSKNVARWKTRLRALNGVRVGICWQGNQEFANDRFRSTRLRNFERLARIPNVELVSLQKGPGTEQIESFDGPILHFDDMDSIGGAFMDTAAIMNNLDLVISTDTAVPHLAGALGIPVWLATNFNCEWRWMLQGDSNPWYPTMRLFRQPKLEDWESVFSAIEAALRDFAQEQFDMRKQTNRRG